MGTAIAVGGIIVGSTAVKGGIAVDGVGCLVEEVFREN